LPSRRRQFLRLRSDRLSPNSAYPREGETRNNIVVCNGRVIRQNIGLGPSVGHQINHEFDRKPRSANDRFVGEHVGERAKCEDDRSWSRVTLFFKGDITRT